MGGFISVMVSAASIRSKDGEAGLGGRLGGGGGLMMLKKAPKKALGNWCLPIPSTVSSDTCTSPSELTVTVDE